MIEEIKQNMLRLTSRWQSEEMQAVLNNVVSALQSQQPWIYLLSNLLDIEDVYTRMDLRGSPIGCVALNHADFKEVRLDFVNLRNANLENADFRGADLVYADLSETNLMYANFEGCIMPRINLTKANLSNARLAGAVLAGGNLTQANFSGADLSKATLVGVKREGTIFEGAILEGTRFGEFAKEPEDS